MNSSEKLPLSKTSYSLKKWPFKQNSDNQVNCKTKDHTSNTVPLKEPTTVSPGLKSWNLDTWFWLTTDKPTGIWKTDHYVLLVPFVVVHLCPPTLYAWPLITPQSLEEGPHLVCVNQRRNSQCLRVLNKHLRPDHSGWQHVSRNASGCISFSPPHCRIKEPLCLHVALALINSKQGKQRKEVPLPGLVERVCLTRCPRMLFWRKKEKETSKRRKL